MLATVDLPLPAGPMKRVPVPASRPPPTSWSSSPVAAGEGVARELDRAAFMATRRGNTVSPPDSIT